MKNTIKTILIFILLFLIGFVIFKIFDKREVKEKLVITEETIMIDLGDVLLLVNDNKITNAIYYTYDGAYLLGDKDIINKDLDSLLEITELLNTYNRLNEITIYDNAGLSNEVDNVLSSKKYKVERVIYTSLITLEDKITRYNILSDIAGLDRVGLITKLYDNSNRIKKEVNTSLELENMTHRDMRKYMLREIDEIKLLLENGKEYKITKKMGYISGNNRIYYCYDDGRCFIYDLVDNKKKQIFLDEKLMKLNYSYYLNYEVTYSTSTVSGNFMCQGKDGNWITVNGYVKNTPLEYYKEFLDCATKK